MVSYFHPLDFQPLLLPSITVLLVLESLANGYSEPFLYTASCSEEVASSNYDS